MSTLKITSAAAILAASFALTACGGDDNSLPATPVTTPPTTAGLESDSGGDLLTSGDDICAETNTAVGTVQANETDAASELSQVADLYDGMVSQLAALPGASDDSDLQSVISAGNDVVQAYKDANLAAARGDDPSQAEADADSAYATFASDAQSYGFSECGGEPVASTTSGTDPGTSTAPVTPVAPVTEVPVPVTPVETTPVTPVTPTPVEPTPVAPVAPTGGSGGGAGAPPVAPTGGGSSGGVGPG